MQNPNLVARAEPLDTNLPAYYGLPICAKRVVFVLDTSMSMRGQPMEAAKQALVQVVGALPEAVAFDIVMFDQSSTAWQARAGWPGLVTLRKVRDHRRDRAVGSRDQSLRYWCHRPSALPV